MARPRGHFTLAEVVEASGLTVSTIRSYCAGKADLVRGEDFYVRRFGQWRRALFFTPRGRYRLVSRAYRTFHPHDSPGLHRLPDFSFPGLPPRYVGTSVEEFRQRHRQSVQLILRQYMEGSACAVPQCPCMVHRLGLPQADELARDRAALEERKAARKVKYGK